MKIKVKDIPAAGLTIERDMTAEDFQLPADIIVSQGPLHITAQLQKTTDVVLAKVDLTGTFVFVCRRCLDEFSRQRREHFDLVFEILPATEFVELGGDIREEMIINFTAGELCRNDCKGLCAGCGVNLNQESCRCPAA